MKPREWWAVLETEEDGDEEYSSGAICSDGGGNLYWQDNQFKVIEKSAYDRLSAMCERLAEALDFYSKFTSYNETEIDGEPRIPVYWEDMSGSRARLALAEYRAMKGEKNE